MAPADPLATLLARQRLDDHSTIIIAGLLHHLTGFLKKRVETALPRFHPSAIDNR
ncbi:MAG: hypothetical protein V2I32_07740 [Desulforhopalus sp.]|jgi:hypothetical protein|nr:hypothetical protein [Desulforhopalus sp.]